VIKCFPLRDEYQDKSRVNSHEQGKEQTVNFNPNCFQGEQ
jgi:hypothetical protein